MNEYKKNVITENIKARLEEIASYEINIFNYEYMLKKVEDSELSASLTEGITSNIREMNKIKLVLEALEAQLASLE